MLALDLSDIFAWDIDFTTDSRNGDTFKVVIEGLYLNGKFRKYGHILSAEFVNNGETYRVYRFTDEGGADYYDASGKSLKKAFLKVPLSFRRISSTFSNGRFHPILKITRPHHGIDYAAPQGTPVSAAGDSTVVFAGRRGQYGNLVILRHRNGYKTYYGHLSKILVKNNQEVRAGEPIGLGGRTGRATTTHLHFETRFLGEHFNPARIIDFDNYTLKQDKLIVDKYFFSKKKTADKSVNSQGAVAEDNSSTKKYHTIKTGDTLYALALRYKTTVSKITRLNGISERKTLKVGSRLRVK